MAVYKAIAAFEMLRELMLFDPTHGEIMPLTSLNEDNRNLYNAAGLAINILHEYAVRNEGCRYCADNFSFWQAQISGELPNVRYCPMCGRRLN